MSGLDGKVCPECGWLLFEGDGRDDWGEDGAKDLSSGAGTLLSCP